MNELEEIRKYIKHHIENHILVESDSDAVYAAKRYSDELDATVLSAILSFGNKRFNEGVDLAAESAEVVKEDFIDRKSVESIHHLDDYDFYVDKQSILRLKIPE